MLTPLAQPSSMSATRYVRGLKICVFSMCGDDGRKRRPAGCRESPPFATGSSWGMRRK
jgi:hypothetical protein